VPWGQATASHSPTIYNTTTATTTTTTTTTMTTTTTTTRTNIATEQWTLAD